MRSPKAFGLLCLLTTCLSAAPVIASPDLDQLCTSFPLNSQCDGYVPSSSDEGNTADPNTGYTVLNAGDWRTSNRVPLSEPVIVRDAFDGDYLAVIDKNFSGNLRLSGQQDGVITNWSEDYIRVYAYSIRKPCAGIDLFCPPSTTVIETSSLDIKVGEEVFRLEGSNGNFPVSAELAAALRNAPAGQAVTRVTLEDSGSQVVNNIGAATVEAWRVVYADDTPETNSASF